WTGPAKSRVRMSDPVTDETHSLSATGMRVGVIVTGDTDGDGRPDFATTGLDGTNACTWGAGKLGDSIIEKPVPAPEAVVASPAGPTLPNLEGTTVPHLLVADVDADGRNELLLYDN